MANLKKADAEPGEINTENRKLIFKTMTLHSRKINASITVKRGFCINFTYLSDA